MRYIYTIVFAVFLGIGNMLSAQTLVRTPSIQLTVGSMTASTVDLTWISPQGVDSCFIIYSDSMWIINRYPVPNYTANRTTIPRTLQAGTYEHFRIIFVDTATSDYLYHDPMVMNAYGGLVLIEEEIFAKNAIEASNGAVFPPISYFNIQPGGYLVEPATISNLVFPILLGQGINPFTSWHAIQVNLDEVAFHDTIIQAIMGLDQAGDSSVHYYGNQLEYTEQATSEPITLSEELSIGPSPCSNTLRLFFAEGSEIQRLHMKVFSAFGMLVEERTVYVQQGSGQISVATGEWPVGVYIIQLNVDGKQHQFKITKGDG